MTDVIWQLHGRVASWWAAGCASAAARGGGSPFPAETVLADVLSYSARGADTADRKQRLQGEFAAALDRGEEGLQCHLCRAGGAPSGPAAAPPQRPTVAHIPPSGCLAVFHGGAATPKTPRRLQFSSRARPLHADAGGDDARQQPLAVVPPPGRRSPGGSWRRRRPRRAEAGGDGAPRACAPLAMKEAGKRPTNSRRYKPQWDPPPPPRPRAPPRAPPARAPHVPGAAARPQPCRRGAAR